MSVLLFIVYCAVLYQWKWFAKDIAKFLDLVETYRESKDEK